jgi:putative membrane protein
MIVSKSIKFLNLIKWSGHHIVWLLCGASFIACLYRFGVFTFSIPWLPVSIIGTAVAFYVGFKNSQSYDRLWEARKIWGGIVNDSRCWGMMVDGFITNQFTETEVNPSELQKIKKKLIYRHLAWIYAHRSQLLIPTTWEHISQGGVMAKTAKRYQRRFGVGLVDDEVTQVELSRFLPKGEYDELINRTNTATQIINAQSKELKELRRLDLIDDFRHMEMAMLLKNFYTHQGKNERIKKFPFPRQYANMSRYFIGIFLLLVPFSMIPELMKIGDWGFWLSIPITALIGWVYVMMEVVGDYSENPFSGMANDIPMLSLCRTIEIDLREMLDETDLPKPIEAKNDILM